MAKKKTQPETPDTETKTPEQLREFHDEVMSYHSSLVVVNDRIEKHKKQGDKLKEEKKDIETGLAAFLNDAARPLLNGSADGPLLDEEAAA